MSIGGQFVEMSTQMRDRVQQEYLPAIEKLDESLESYEEQGEQWLQALEASVRQAGQVASDMLKQSAEEFSASAQTLIESGGKLRSDMTQGRESVESLDGVVEQLTQPVIQQGKDIRQLLSDFDSFVNEQGEAISGQFGSWTVEVESAVQTLEGLHGQLSSSLGSLEELAIEKLDQIQTSSADFHAQARTQLEQITGSLVENLQHINEDFSGYIREASEIVDGDTGALLNALADFSDKADHFLDLFQGGLGDVADALESVTNLLEAIEPVIDIIKAAR